MAPTRAAIGRIQPVDSAGQRLRADAGYGLIVGRGAQFGNAGQFRWQPWSVSLETLVSLAGVGGQVAGVLQLARRRRQTDDQQRPFACSLSSNSEGDVSRNYPTAGRGGGRLTQFSKLARLSPCQPTEPAATALPCCRPWGCWLLSPAWLPHLRLPHVEPFGNGHGTVASATRT